LELASVPVLEWVSASESASVLEWGSVLELASEWVSASEWASESGLAREPVALERRSAPPQPLRQTQSPARAQASAPALRRLPAKAAMRRA
jgi:hypothetical protein